MSKNKQPNAQLNPNVSVDCVILGFDFDQLNVLLIERTPRAEDLKKDLMLPGDLIREDENLDRAAKRVLKELTSLGNIYLEQFQAFGEPNRVRKERDAEWLKAVRAHPDARVITVAYYSLVKLKDFIPRPSSFATITEWHPVREAGELAFDHNDILEGALNALKLKIRHSPIGLELLPRKFTLGQLQKLYEAILEKDLDKRNFRRKMLKSELMIALDERQKNVPHKPAQYFKFDVKRYEELGGTGFDFGM